MQPAAAGANAPELLIGEVFRRNAEAVPEADAASLGGMTWSHAELETKGLRVAAALRELGVGHGDRVVSWADSSLSILPLFVGLAKLGAVFAPLNARLGADEAADVAALARASLLVVDPSRANVAEQVAASAGIAAVGHYGAAGAGACLEADALPEASGPIHEPALREGDPHVLFFTSGSTGRPKGVVLSHRANHLRTFQGVFRDVPERSVCMFPMFHMAAFTLGLAAWQTRGHIAFVESATASDILDAVERHRSNRLYCIPLVWTRILEQDTSKWNLSSLRELDTGTSATPIELVRALKQRFPDTATRIYYGSTEVGSATTLPDTDVLRKPGSVGLPTPGVDIQLASDGEICVRSPFLADGYFDAPEQTAEALQEGWFHTGDLAVMDTEGYFAIVGRKKELIRSGGESVAPAEVEAALAEAPGVAEVCVVGVPDVEWGEIVCAVIVEEPDARVSLSDLQRHCEGRIAGFKKPRRLGRVEALPRTAATGQVQRTLLVEQLQAGSIPLEE